MTEDIKNFTLDELRKTMEPGYRALQVFRWVYRLGAEEFSGMSNLPPALREELSRRFSLRSSSVALRRVSEDGTEKLLFRLSDGKHVESVIIPAEGRLTTCLSTQAGCRFGCVFCASGAGGFLRDLTPGEILDQLLEAKKNPAGRVTNAVFMGMGEPLDNLPSLLKVLRVMTDPAGMNISARRITVSTCGLIPGIEKLSKLDIPLKLAVSLHAPTQELRRELMPVSRKYPLEPLMNACEKFIRGNRRLTLEYVLMRGVNDSPLQARRLAKLANRLGAVVNLLAFSAVPGQQFLPSGENETEAFIRELSGRGARLTFRRPRGADIAAACGQLSGGGAA